MQTELIMETRTCALGSCSKQFKVLATSKQETCSKDCQWELHPNPRLNKAAQHRQMTVNFKPIKGGHPEWRPGKRAEPYKPWEGDPNPESARQNKVTTNQQTPNPIKPTEKAELSPGDLADLAADPKTTEPDLTLPMRRLLKKASDVIALTNEDLPARFKEQPSAEQKPKRRVKATPEERWQSYVDRASKLVAQRATLRMEIIEIALEACDIKYGGGNHWKQFEGVYTLKKFAEDIGLGYKTLANWVRTKRNVVDKLTCPYDPKTDWNAAVRTSDKLRADATKEEATKAFLEWQKPKKQRTVNQNRYLLQNIRKLRSLNFFLQHKAETRKLSKLHLAELKREIGVTQKWVRENV